MYGVVIIKIFLLYKLREQEQRERIYKLCSRIVLLLLLYYTILIGALVMFSLNCVDNTVLRLKFQINDITNLSRLYSYFFTPPWKKFYFFGGKKKSFIFPDGWKKTHGRQSNTRAHE